MFKRIREHSEEKCISGLSKGLRVVDKRLQPGMSAKQLDMTVGAAHVEIHQLYEDGEITWAEREAAVHTLYNHYEKMWHMATLREKNA